MFGITGGRKRRWRQAKRRREVTELGSGSSRMCGLQKQRGGRKSGRRGARPAGSLQRTTSTARICSPRLGPVMLPLDC